MSGSPNWLLYGANGYTGRLIAREAARRGLKPVLAGRDRAAIEKLAGELKLPSRVFSLDDSAALQAALRETGMVLHCAGPFSATAAPMLEACIASRAHYFDITGEIDVIEAAAALDGRARVADVVLMPAVGFDVVPTDCLAAMLAARVATATNLELAFDGGGGLSPGTTRTMLQNLPHGGRARIGGKLERVPSAWKSREIPFAKGSRWAMTIPWGDVASAWYSTAIPNITVYLGTPPGSIRKLRMFRGLLPLAALPPVQYLLEHLVAKRVTGPNESELSSSRTSLWGRAWDDQGHAAEATMETPGGYAVTVATSLAVIERMLAGLGPGPGFITPSRAFGADLIHAVDRVEVAWRNETSSAAVG